MTEEKYPDKENSSKKMQAKVILARCSSVHGKSDNLFGMRVQKFGSDWKRTWAFKIDEERAHNEGYDKESTNGTFDPVEGYPGCPYCHSTGLATCGCGKVFCFKDEEGNDSTSSTLTCPWCGETATYEEADRLDLQGGGY